MHPLPLFTSVMLEAVRFFLGQSGAGAATKFLLPHTPPSPATARSLMRGPDIVGPGESGPYVPTFRGVLPGGMSGFGAEGVAVDAHEK